MLDRMAACSISAAAHGCLCRCSRPDYRRWWIGLVTPVDVGVARPLVEGLAVPTAVTDPSGAELFDDVHPIGFDEALRRAVAEDPELRPRRDGLSGTPAAIRR